MNSENSILIIQPLGQNHSVVKSDFFTDAIAQEMEGMNHVKLIWMLPDNQWNLIYTKDVTVFYKNASLFKTLTSTIKELAVSKVIFILPYMKISLKDFLYFSFLKNKYKLDWVVFVDQKLDRFDFKTNFLQKKIVHNASKIFSYDLQAFNTLKAKNRNRMVQCQFSIRNRKGDLNIDPGKIANWKTHKKVLLICNEDSKEERGLVKRIIQNPKLEMFGIQINIICKNEFFYQELIQLKTHKNLYFEAILLLDFNELNIWISSASCICLPCESRISSAFAAYLFSFGKPIITTHEAAMQIVKHEQNGYISHATPQDLSAQIIRYFTDLKSSQLQQSIKIEMEQVETNSELEIFFKK